MNALKSLFQWEHNFYGMELFSDLKLPLTYLVLVFAIVLMIIPLVPVIHWKFKTPGIVGDFTR